MKEVHSGVEFNIKELNESADRAFMPGHFAIIGGGVLMSIISLAILAKVLASWPSGAVLVPELIGPIIIWSFTGFLIIGGVAEVREKWQGASRIKLDEQGVELLYPSGARVTSRWSDPSLSFDLFEYSDTPARGMVFGGRVSQLTPDAYARLLSEAEVRGLVQEVSRGGPLLISKSLRPIVRRVRGISHSQT